MDINRKTIDRSVMIFLAWPSMHIHGLPGPATTHGHQTNAIPPLRWLPHGGGRRLFPTICRVGRCFCHRQCVRVGRGSAHERCVGQSFYIPSGCAVAGATLMSVAAAHPCIHSEVERRSRQRGGALPRPILAPSWVGAVAEALQCITYNVLLTTNY